MALPVMEWAVHLRRSKCANGDDEWYLQVGTERVPNPGVFVPAGQSPADMLPRVLRKIAS